MLDVPSALSLRQRARLHRRATSRAIDRYGVSFAGLVGRLNRQPVFVVGSPRSGTSFTASSLGDVPGFADLGEVNRIKAAAPRLYESVIAGQPDDVIRELRRALRLTHRTTLTANRRFIEQTPECTYLIPELAEAFPEARFIHLLRDGRDVATSLIETGWLSPACDTTPAGRERQRNHTDDAGLPLGSYARFWVEVERRREFERSSEARRAAWAWRRYVTAAITGLAQVDVARALTIRYEQLATDPLMAARQISAHLQAEDRTAAFAGALSGVHRRSVGRYAAELPPAQLREVLDEAGTLLDELGYAGTPG